MLGRYMHNSTQLPVRISLLMLGALILLADRFGFESIFGAFAGGMVMGQVTRGGNGRALREKMETISFGWFYPFFFVGAGIKFNAAALVQDFTTVLLVPTFAVLFLVVRGAPVLLYRGHIDPAHRLPFALSSAVPSLSIIVVITEIGVRGRSMNPDVAAAMIGAALLSVLLFPTIAGSLLPDTPCADRAATERPLASDSSWSLPVEVHMLCFGSREGAETEHESAPRREARWD